MENIFSQTVIKQLMIKPQLLRTAVRYRFFLLLIALMILALARPVYVKQDMLVKQMSSSAVIALDVSKSMHASDIYPSRLGLARHKLLKLIEKANNLHVGVVLFAKNTYMLYPVTEDTQALAYILKNADINPKLEPNTNFFGMLEAVKKILREEKTKNIILFTDGGEDVSRADEISYILKNNLKLYTIDFNTKANNSLKNMVQKSKGYYTKYQWTQSDVEYILNSIQKSSEQIIVNESNMKQYQELFMYPLGIALLIFYFVFIVGLRQKYIVKLTLFISFAQLTLYSTPASAGVFDFIKLHKAESYYEQKQYERAVQYYKELEPTSEVNYNIANALYKNHDYLKAVVYYKRALTKDKLLNAKIYYNIGNCYVQRGKLELAKSQYERSLKLHTYEQTKKNLNIITQELKKRKKLKSIFNRGPAKVYFKSRLEETNNDYKVSSNYKIKLKKLVLSEEEKWIKIIHEQKTPLFLQKIPTKRISLDTQKPW